ncbi:cysteine hydrolase family protein [Salinibacterium sp. ZJ450]|uniref:cysteine hydrolase family protein n=1 Tax=Salinibacterium sp. ZJ450 TaxID=2708338 RepID=UPI001422DDF4|nr:cysteine hydrolase [Salinibacterium sp. ZJ450]
MQYSRPALLMLDYQVALCDPEANRAPALAAQVAERAVVPVAQAVLAAARDAELLIIHVRLAFDDTYLLRTNRLARFDSYPENRAMLRGSAEAAIIAQLAPEQGEPVLDKSCVDPFIGSPLLSVLHAEGIGEIIIGGVATNLVVESTARHASDSGLQVTIVEDMCASFSPAAHDFAMANILPMFGSVFSSAEVIGRLSEHAERGAA